MQQIGLDHASSRLRIPASRPEIPEPFRLDYIRWAQEIAQLTVVHPNLVAWSIDDFAHNLKVYTPEQTAEMLAVARRIAPRLAFVPCVYYRQCRPEFAQAYGALFDGLLFPYRNESGQMNLTDTAAVPTEVAQLKERERCRSSWMCMPPNIRD